MHVFDDNKKRFRTFLNAYSEPYPKYIDELKQYAHDTDVPIITDDTRDIIKLLLNIKKPKKVLELGAAIGYSTLVICKYTNKKCKIDTVENYKKRILLAKKNFKKYDIGNKITLYNTDITDFLNKKGKVKNIDKYDFIFLDAAKAQYVVWLDNIIKLMNKNAILLSDNILKDGEILESRYTIRKRDRTIHKRMREFIYNICHNELLDSYILDIGDGLTVSIKK